MCLCVRAYLKEHQKSQPDDMIPKFLNQKKRLQEVRVSLDVLLLSSQKQRESGRVEGMSGRESREKKEKENVRGKERVRRKRKGEREGKKGGKGSRSG